MTTKKLQYALVDWRIWPQWVLANAVAGAVALAVTGAMIRASSLDADLVVVVFGLLIGAALGTMQWLVLRRWISRAYLYMLASIGGFALALSAGEAVGFSLGGSAGWLAGGTILGIITGTITGAALVWLLHQPNSDK